MTLYYMQHGFHIVCHCYHFFLDKDHKAENLQSVCLFPMCIRIWSTIYRNIFAWVYFDMAFELETPKVINFTI